MPLLLRDEFPDAVRTGEVLTGRGWTVATAESCTGGLLGAVLTAIPGSSAWVRGGVVAYSNDVKVDLLAVDAGVLAREGAVSEPVAVAMARGARERCGADLGIGITGIAGPGADGSAKPAGLIWLAVAAPAGTTTLRLEGDHGREENRARAVRAALEMIIAAAATA